MLLHASRQNVVVRVERSCLYYASYEDMVAPQASLQAAPGQFTSRKARSDGRGAVLRGLYDGLGRPKCAQCMLQTVKSWPKRQDCCMPEPQ